MFSYIGLCVKGTLFLCNLGMCKCGSKEPIVEKYTDSLHSFKFIVASLIIADVETHFITLTRRFGTFVI